MTTRPTLTRPTLTRPILTSPALNTPGTAPADGMPAPARYWAYATIVIGLALAVLDATVANVALPTIAQDFAVSPARSIEIVSAYQLIIVVLLLPLAALGDIYGYRRVYLAGICVFTLASLACALSGSLDTLTAARILQGVGAAGIMSVNTALVRYIFPQSGLGRAIGFNALTVAVSSTIGPSFASAMLAVASWHWLFAINVPLGVVALMVGWRSLPESSHSGQRFDVLSAILTAIGLGLLIITINAAAHGVGIGVICLMVAVGVAALALAVRRQARTPAPLLPVDLLRIPIFALSIGTSICSFTAQMLAFVALPFLLETGFGYHATEVGFLIMPWPLAVAIAAPISGWLSDKFPAAILGLAGLAALAAGLVLLATLPPHPGIFQIAWRMALCGAGFGLFQSPNNRTMITSAPKSRTGAASGMLGTARLLGQATGAALVALLLAHIPAHGAVTALVAAAGFAGVAAILSILRLA
ncbi:MAG: MFS transporter [Acidocella sp.]|nr:MFS transporter [Acidocella sp.]